MAKVAEKTIGRLSLYRRFLHTLITEGKIHVFSHQLAKTAGVTAAQVRRDFMAIGYMGSPVRGYEIEALIASIAEFLDVPEGQNVALVGVGNLGRAILTYFRGRRPKLQISVAFDNDPQKTNRVIHNCKCYPVEMMDQYIKEQNIITAILTVPAEKAQEVADHLVESGIRGILNFAPVRLHKPSAVHIEYIDMTMELEKVAYFAAKSIL